MFAHYRALIELRRSDPVVAHGDFTMLLPEDERIYAFTRQLDDVTLLVLANFSGAPAAATIPDGAQWAAAEVVLGNYSGSGAPTTDPGGAIRLRPWEALVLRTAG